MPNSSVSGSSGCADTRTAMSRLLYARVYAFLVAARLLQRLPPRRLPLVLEPRRPRPHPDERRAREAADAVTTLLATRRPFLPTGCLPQGLALFYFLRRAGLDVGLTFGVSTATDPPSAHCWLTRDARPYLEKVDPTEHFVAIWSIEPRRR